MLRLYLALPVALATSERTFSAPGRLKTYLRSTMKQDRLNNCLLLYCHNSFTYRKEVCLCKRTRQKTFWKIRVEVCAWLNDEVDEHRHVSKRHAVSAHS